ncbi:MAG TPA: cob(I)yrinic acid a,c-diamide adenosyltransferase [Nitrosopumilaceae archaeon]|nr:cob(I)yrinic acid a,c-diamide adenosyltransferase [Nitrosopumilaceae archaeon]
MKIYTKTGDDGSTGLQGGTRLSKSHLRIIAYGAVDEINVILGIILADKIHNDITIMLKKIQNDLFVVGSDLSNPNLSNKKNRISEEMVKKLENNIDVLEKDLPQLTNFILPGGDRFASLVHLARAVTRRAETNVVSLYEIEEINVNCIKYLNRLSDLFFVIARTINKRAGIEDIIWKP